VGLMSSDTTASIEQENKEQSKEQEKKKEETTDVEDNTSGDENQKQITSVKDFGVSSDQNWKHRRRMEDAHYVEDGFMNDPNKGFFAIYDGHGGKDAAIFSSKTLHKVLEEFLSKESEDIYNNSEKVLEILKNTYLETDNRMKGSVPTHHGCTAVTCLITGKGDSRHLFSANAGDARATLCRDGKAIRLTEEHKASDPAEAKRIQDLGCFIVNGRVNGQIVITRSLGDHMMKEFIIGDPFLSYQKLTEKDTHLIVACDGLWDVVEDQQACDFLLAYPNANADELSKRLLVKALQDGSTDNLSICVVKL